MLLIQELLALVFIGLEAKKPPKKRLKNSFYSFNASKLPKE